jgi:16S rRNA (cytosine967-C5)-methyltransferase
MVRRPSRSRGARGGRGPSGPASDRKIGDGAPPPGARRIAYDVLLRVERGGAFAGLALDVALRERPDLDRRERALATELVYGTLRRVLALEAVLAEHASRPLAEVDDRVRVLLRLGAYQLLHLRIPDHAAVGETVALCRAVGAGGASGFVNAVLRALARAPAVAPPALDVDPARHLLLTEGLPGWLFEEWRRQLPLEEVADLARASNQPAPVTLRAASPEHRREVLEKLAEAGVPARPTERSPVGIVLEEGAHPESLPGWDALGLQPQDEGAQLVTAYALLPSRHRGAEPGAAAGAPPSGTGAADGPARILDACAAPGGKACHLAQALPEARLVATDLHRRRAARVATEAARLGLADRIETHAADATHPLPFVDGAPFDLVLLDAPCTGLGTLRRHPEIKLTRTADDVARLAELQDRLLDNLAGYVAPGGLLVYAVCTSTLAEGPERVARFLGDHPDFEADPPAIERGAGPWDTLLRPDGAFSSWTHRHGTDGFFAARLRRR